MQDFIIEIPTQVHNDDLTIVYKGSTDLQEFKTSKYDLLNSLRYYQHQRKSGFQHSRSFLHF